MSVLTQIEQAGFKVFLNGNLLGVAPAVNLTPPQQEFLKSHKREIVAELEAYQKITNWLNSIGEDDQSIIDETIARCKTDPDALRYFLQRADNAIRLH